MLLVRKKALWVSALAASAALSLVSIAQAEVSSWVFVGGGPSFMSQNKSSYDLKPTLQADLGVGTSPAKSVVVGGIARATPYLGHGTDLALAARIATQSYATGDFGLALDAGGFARWWGESSTGFLTSLQLGAPWGIVLSLNASFGSADNATYGAVLGVDLARLTVYRLSGESQWPNIRPAYRPEKKK